MITPKNQQLRKISSHSSIQPDDNSLKSILRNNTDSLNSKFHRSGVSRGSFLMKFDEVVNLGSS